MADDGKEKKGCCERVGDGFSNFAKFLFNRETGQVMGRSGESWLKIGLFYLIFYGFLAAFFSAMLTVFLKTLNDPETGKGPKLVQFIENKPGLTYKKLWDIKTIKDGVTDKQKAAFKKFVTEDILEKYNGTTICEDNVKGMPTGVDCVYNTTLLGKCGPDASDKNFGLDDMAPCVYIRINKVFGWVPAGTKGGNYLKLKCDKMDVVEIFPQEGFQIGSFPFRGQKNYEPPVVAVKIDSAKLNGKKDKKVVCQLEGPNIEVSESSVAHRAYAKVEIS